MNVHILYKACYSASIQFLCSTTSTSLLSFRCLSFQKIMGSLNVCVLNQSVPFLSDVDSVAFDITFLDCIVFLSAGLIRTK